LRIPGESRDAWLERFRLNAVSAQDRISAETGQVPTLYAWPYGEFNADVQQVISKLGWYGLGQQSGAAGYDASMTAVPRFPITTGFADIDAFVLRVNSEPLPLRITDGADRLLASGDPAPELLFSMDDDRYSIDSVSCYNSRGDRLAMTRQGAQSRSVRSESPLPAGRSKYTCTAPHRTKSGVFGWYSHQWIVQ
jgi:hypothetical protein